MLRVKLKIRGSILSKNNYWKYILLISFWVGGQLLRSGVISAHFKWYPFDIICKTSSWELHYNKKIALVSSVILIGIISKVITNDTIIMIILKVVTT